MRIKMNGAGGKKAIEVPDNFEQEWNRITRVLKKKDMGKRLSEISIIPERIK